MEERTKRRLVGIGLTSLVLKLSLVASGFSFGVGTNIQPHHNKKIEIISFKEYLSESKEKVGDNPFAYALATWTYPGARTGAAVHNYFLYDGN